jgi:6-pyruvoyltetrahydropterin/6-carboxytetrahydropterin synthase
MGGRLFHTAAASFEAARRLANRPVGDRARRLHGHSFVARIHAEVPADWARPPRGETDSLAGLLEQEVTALDYSDLNEHLQVPSDENLARWLSARLATVGLESVWIQSTKEQGAELVGHPGRLRVWRRFRFEAAHWLPNVAPDHQCGRLHGHGFEVILYAWQDPIGAGSDAQDGAVDSDRLAGLWAPLQDQLHHRCLNDIPGLENPTSELLARWIWERLEPRLPTLSWVGVLETSTAGCCYDGQDFRIWKALRFEAALQRHRLPQDDPRRLWHGHSYKLRLHLRAPLDEVLGWTVDYGDVKALFTPVYRQLDHQALNDLPELSDTDPGSLARWIRAEAAKGLPQLDGIELEETPGRGVALCAARLWPGLPI